MAWARRDDNSGEHPKVLALSDRAYRFWSESIVYSCQQLTDGRMGPQALGAVARLCHMNSRGLRKVLMELCTPVEGFAAGLFEKNGQTYLIHDFLVYNPSRAQVEQRKELRKKAGRKGGKASARKRQASASPSAQADAGCRSNPDPTRPSAPTEQRGPGDAAAPSGGGTPPAETPAALGDRRVQVRHDLERIGLGGGPEGRQLRDRWLADPEAFESALAKAIHHQSSGGTRFEEVSDVFYRALNGAAR